MSICQAGLATKSNHNHSGKLISFDEMMENEDGDIFEAADPRGESEQKVISEMQIAAFAEQSITEKDQEILKLRMDSFDRTGGQSWLQDRHRSP